MAEFYAGAQANEPASGLSIGTLTNWLGAIVSIALIVGVAVWGYKLLVRDVSGVPVIRAAEGPMRVQPDNPGGRPADHQGLAVNAVAADGSAEGPADRLVLAPRPVDLTDEDAPSAQLAARAPVAAPDADAAPLAQRDAEADEPRADAALRNVAGSVDDLVSQLTADATPLSATNDSSVPAPEAAEDDTAAAVAAATRPTHALARSLRPQVRPSGLAAQVASTDPAVAAAVAAASSATRDIDADAIPAGTRLAQLGAYDSAEVARQQWDQLQQRFGEYMDGKDRVIQRAQSGGRTFYRLRAMGFDDLADARRFCAAFVAEKADCIPVVTR